MTGGIGAVLGINVAEALLGLGLMPLIGVARDRRELRRRWPLAYLTGLVATGIVACDLAIAGIALQPWLLAVLTVAALAGGGLRLRRRSGAPIPTPRRRLPALRLLAIPAAAGSVALGVVALRAFRVWPLAEWDGWAIWAQKARALATLGDVHNPPFTDQAYALSHLGYPLFLPGLEAIDIRAARFDGPLLHVQLWLLAVAVAAALVALLRDRLPAEATALVVLVPLALPGVLPSLASNYADLPLALLMAVALTALARWLQTGEGWLLTPAAGLLGAAALTKNEGLLFVLAALVAVVGVCLVMRLTLRPVFLCLAGVAAVLAPWRIWVAVHRFPVTDYRLSDLLHPHYLSGRTGRVSPAASTLFRHADGAAFGHAGPLVIVALAAAMVARRYALVAFTALWLALSFAGLVAIYWISPLALGPYLASSASRVVATVALGGTVLALIAVGESWRDDVEVETPAKVGRGDGVRAVP